MGPKKLYFTGTGTKRKILAGPEPGPKKKLPGPEPNKKSYRELDRDQKKLVPHISRLYSYAYSVNLEGKELLCNDY